VPKWLFWRSRLRGIWALLTCRYFVVLTSNTDASKLRCHYNVSHPSYRFIAQALDEAIEVNEASKILLKNANEIIGRV
jgi:hypothetical protein